MNPETVSELFPSKWLKADDLSQPVSIAIESVQFEDVYDKEERKYVPKLTIAFHKAQKRMIPNKTQCEAIWQITGTERFADWVGHIVQLAPGMALNRKPTIMVSKAASQAKPEPEQTKMDTDTETESATHYQHEAA